MIKEIKNKVIKWLGGSPKLKRYGFTGANVNRLTIGMPQFSYAINADLDNSLVILRGRARSLAANNEYGRRFLSLVTDNVVGPRGPSLQVRRYDKNSKLDKALNNAIESAWVRWCRQCDVTGRLTWRELLKLVITSIARDGEALVRIVRGDPYNKFKYSLQVLEADRLDERYNVRLENGNRVRMGVELDTTSRPVALWVFTAHPGEASFRPQRFKRERVPIEDLFHLFVPERAEQVRGYTWFHAVITRAMMLGGFEEAAVVAARLGASKVAAITRNPDSLSSSELDELATERKDNALTIDVEAGEFIDLTGMPGTEISSWNPEYPNQNYESFVKQCLRGLSMGLDVAVHNLSGDMTDVNYSSARIAELSERNTWIGLQEWLIEKFCRPVFEEWLNLSLLRGLIKFPKTGSLVPAALYQDIIDAVKIQGRRWEWVDPQKASAANKSDIESRLTSRTRIAASQGYEMEDIIEELAEEERMMLDAGLKVDGGGNADTPVQEVSTDDEIVDE